MCQSSAAAREHDPRKLLGEGNHSRAGCVGSNKYGSNARPVILRIEQPRQGLWGVRHVALIEVTFASLW